ncbi:GntR family transcriptional regulator [Rhodovulum sp. DZ06]|uniref:GntR family transcriptional regulator n=1 Tax=Rhodovulum sp. DZ06 TaxID=3425126 RepID=UPI003D329AC4
MSAAEDEGRAPIGAPEMTQGHGRSAPDTVVRAVIRGLYEGRYVPGQRLGEPDLISEYGVSRSTVREAIRRLEADGVVETIPYRGAQIRRLTAREARDALLLFQALIALAARLAAERIGEADGRERVAEAWKGLEAQAADLDGFDGARARDRFHRALAAASGNRDVMRVLPGMQAHLIRFSWSAPAETKLDSYKAIVRAVLSGEAEKAEAAARAHVDEILALVVPEI